MPRILVRSADLKARRKRREAGDSKTSRPAPALVVNPFISNMEELIEHHEWDKLLSVLEKVADDDDNDDGDSSSAESWSILLVSFCKAAITDGMNTATKAKTTLDDDDDVPSTRSTAPSSSTLVSKRDNVTNKKKHPRIPPLPSTISSIISHFVRISSL